MKRFVTAAAIAGLVATAGFLGCAHDSQVEEQFGEAFRAQRAAMVVHPEAGDGTTVEGIDARSAEHVLESYSEGQKAQEHPRGGSRRGSGIVIGDMQ